MKFYTFILLLHFATVALGQVKTEREFRIQAAQVPSVATEWLHTAFSHTKKVKWYSKVTGSKQTFEAKFRWKGKQSSVEFDSTGITEDVEIITKWSEIPLGTRQSILTYLAANFKNHKILKIQTQLVGSPSSLMGFLKETSQEGIALFFEIEFMGKTETQHEILEAQFNSDGHLKHLQRIILPPPLNMDF